MSLSPDESTVVVSFRLSRRLRDALYARAAARSREEGRHVGLSDAIRDACARGLRTSDPGALPAFPVVRYRARPAA